MTTDFSFSAVLSSVKRWCGFFLVPGFLASEVAQAAPVLSAETNDLFEQFTVADKILVALFGGIHFSIPGMEDSFLVQFSQIYMGPMMFAWAAMLAFMSVFLWLKSIQHQELLGRDTDTVKLFFAFAVSAVSILPVSNAHVIQHAFVKAISLGSQEADKVAMESANVIAYNSLALSENKNGKTARLQDQVKARLIGYIGSRACRDILVRDGLSVNSAQFLNLLVDVCGYRKSDVESFAKVFESTPGFANPSATGMSIFEPLIPGFAQMSSPWIGTERNPSRLAATDDITPSDIEKRMSYVQGFTGLSRDCSLDSGVCLFSAGKDMIQAAYDYKDLDIKAKSSPTSPLATGGASAVGSQRGYSAMNQVAAEQSLGELACLEQAYQTMLSKGLIYSHKDVANADGKNGSVRSSFFESDPHQMVGIGTVLSGAFESKWVGQVQSVVKSNARVDAAGGEITRAGTRAEDKKTVSVQNVTIGIPAEKAFFTPGSVSECFRMVREGEFKLAMQEAMKPYADLRKKGWLGLAGSADQISASISERRDAAWAGYTERTLNPDALFNSSTGGDATRQAPYMVLKNFYGAFQKTFSSEELERNRAAIDGLAAKKESVGEKADTYSQAGMLGTNGSLYGAIFSFQNSSMMQKAVGSTLQYALTGSTGLNVFTSTGVTIANTLTLGSVGRLQKSIQAMFAEGGSMHFMSGFMLGFAMFLQYHDLIPKGALLISACLWAFRSGLFYIILPFAPLQIMSVEQRNWTIFKESGALILWPILTVGVFFLAQAVCEIFSALAWEILVPTLKMPNGDWSFGNIGDVLQSWTSLGDGTMIMGFAMFCLFKIVLYIFAALAIMSGPDTALRYLGINSSNHDFAGAMGDFSSKIKNMAAGANGRSLV